MSYLPHTTPSNNTFPNHNSDQVQAMVASLASLDSLFLDTGAAHHLTNNATHLSDVHSYHGPDQVSIGDGKKVPIHHIGSTFLSTKYKKFKLNKVLHAPKLATNLISVSKLCHDNNSFVEFHPRHFLIKDQQMKNTLLQGKLDQGLYMFPGQPMPRQTRTTSVTTTVTTRTTPSILWHARF